MSFIYHKYFVDKQCKIAPFFLASLAATIACSFSLMFLCCLKILSVLLFLTLFLVLYLMVSSLASFTPWNLHFRLDENSCHLAAS